MINKKFTKLIGLKKEDFHQFTSSGQIQYQNARLIPTLKTGDEMALTSTLLSTVRLVKEFRDQVFKEIKLNRAGKAYFLTEVSFPEEKKHRIDAVILVVIKGVIKDAAFFEMKNKNNKIDKSQIEAYLQIAKKTGVNKLVTISNEFVADSSHSPIDIRVPKSINLYHFSWTYLLTLGQLLLFDNEENIEDADQVEIMKESLHYLENPVSGVSGFTQMKSGWKDLVDAIRNQTSLKQSDPMVEETVLSWHEEEKDMALMLSRKLGVLVRTSLKGKDKVKRDIKGLIKSNTLSGTLSVKNAVSDIRVIVDFERRAVTMSIKTTPPLNKGSQARITWISKQLENCKKRNPETFQIMEKEISVEANIKFAQKGMRVNLVDLDNLTELCKGREITGFEILYLNGFGAKFASSKGFISEIEKMVLIFYKGLVQNVVSWKRPAPKIESEKQT